MERRRFFAAVACTALASMGMKIDARSPFERWCDEVDAIFRRDYEWQISYADSCGRECLREHFDDGISPQDLVDEEVGYWEL